MGIYNFVSLFGIVVFFFFGWLCSNDRKEINWHIVMWGVGLQFLFAWFLFVFPAGVRIFLMINEIVILLMNTAVAGSKFLFGPLALPPGTVSESGQPSLGFILAFQAFPTIIFFSSVMSVLYYLNIIPRIIKAFSSIFTKLMKVSGAESLCAASNVFVGIESALIVRPYLKSMTASELCTVLTVGMATVSSNVLAIYVFSLKDLFPNIAGHLVSASLLSVPAALAMSKVLYPETLQPVTLGENLDVHIERDGGLLESIITGANNGLRLIVGIAAVLIAVLGIVALIDQIFHLLGEQLSLLTHLNIDLSLKNILGMIFYPLTFIMGVPSKDVSVISELIGQRLILTEIVSYQDLAELMKTAKISDMRSVVIATYALCGFAHFASMAIFVGGISSLVPENKGQLAKLAIRSLVGATLACLLTGCVAGVFFVDNSLIYSGIR